MLAQVNGLQVFYELDGNPDKPWLTMVTGITNDTTMWDGQIKALQNTSKVKLKINLIKI